MKRPPRARRAIRFGRSGKGVALILSGSMLGQAIALLVLPLLSRIYSPSAFGVFAVVVAVVAVIAPVAALRFESAAMLPVQDEAVRPVAWNGLLSIVVVAGFSALVIEQLRAADVMQLDSHPYFGLWVGLLVALTAGFSLLTQLALRARHYSLVAKRTLFQSAAMAAGQLGMGLLTRESTGLLAGYTLGRAVGLATLWSSSRAYFQRTSIRDLRSVWRTYWRFPAVFTPSALLNALGLQAPLLFIVFTFGVHIGGQVAMAERIIAIPVALVGAAVAQVLEAEISRRLRNDLPGLRTLYLRTSLWLACLGIGTTALFLLLGGWGVPILLGEDWAVAGVAVQALAITSGVRLVASPMSKYLVVLQRSLITGVLDVLRILLVSIACAVVALLDLDLVVALWVVYSSLTLTYLLSWFCGLWVSLRLPRP